MSESWQRGATIDPGWLLAQEAFGRWIDANPDHPAVITYRELSHWGKERGIGVDLCRIWDWTGPLRIYVQTGWVVDFKEDSPCVTVESMSGYKQDYPEGITPAALLDVIGAPTGEAGEPSWPPRTS